MRTRRKRIVRVLAWTGAAAVAVVGASAIWIGSLQGRSYDVVVVMGQSNALGAGEGWEPLGADAPHANVYQMSSYPALEDLVLPAADPLLNPQPMFGRVGFGLTFAKDYAEATGRDVLIIPVGVGETGFTEAGGRTWDPDNETAPINLYERAVEQIGDALGKNPNSRLVAVLWHQGEGDVRTMSGDEYQERLDRVIDGLRESYGDAPFLVGGMSPDRMAEMGGLYTEVYEAHRTVADRMPETAFVPAPEGMHNVGETIHLNAAGQRYLGNAFWEAYEALAR